MHSTLGELPQMVELCREWSVDQLLAQHIYCVEVTGLQGESLVDTPAESDAVVCACQALCDEYGIRTIFPPAFEIGAAKPSASQPAGSGTLDCYAPWRIVRIRWNADVYPCDLWPGPGLGNLKGQSFAEIWNSTRYTRLRWELARRNPAHPNCRNCNMVTTDNIEGREVKSPLSFTPVSK
jgi:radical SAM protein with 4Fe4S-binding SPASM domain